MSETAKILNRASERMTKVLQPEKYNFKYNTVARYNGKAVVLMHEQKTVEGEIVVRYGIGNLNRTHFSVKISDLKPF